ncbi:MAG: hypothetical protein IPL46_27410 [Saprospiraceae bacterium]|nr:hypothetical protein [Saprospiraceae bacterium]
MKTKQFDRQNTPEINLRTFLRKAWKYNYVYLLSLLFFAALAVVYIKWLPPVYEVETSLLIETQSNSRGLGESQFIDGSIRLFEVEKNLYNEMNLIKSVDLVRRTLHDLNFDVSYHSQKNIIKREHYKEYPFTVDLNDSRNQVLNTPIFIRRVSEETYTISVETQKYETINGSTGKHELHEEILSFTKEHEFDELAETDLYSIIVRKNPDINLAEFADKELYFVAYNVEDLVKSHQNNLKVEQADIQASIINLSTEGEVVGKEVDFLNRLTKNYISEKLLERNKIAKNKVSFIEQQLASISDSLGYAERSLERFKRDADAINLTQTGANALSEYQDLESKEAQSEMNLKYYRSLLDYVRDTSGQSQVVAPSLVGINDALLSENIMELKRLNSELSRIQFLQGDKSPDAGVVLHQIENTRSSLEENLRSLIASTSLSINNLNSRRSSIEKTINMLPTREKNLINYQRKTKLFENLYNYLSQELAKTNIAQAEELPDIKVINEARMLGDRPKAPQKELALIVAILLGLLLPSVFVYGQGEGDGSISDIKMIEEHSEIPVLAQIAIDPSLKKKIPLSQIIGRPKNPSGIFMPISNFSFPTTGKR